MNRARSLAADGVDYALVAVLLAIGSTSFLPVFGTSEGFFAALAGIVSGLIVALVTARRHVSLAPTALLALLVHLSIGTLLQMRFEPAGKAAVTNLTATVTVWKDFLTVSPPVSAFTSMTVLPWIAALVCSLAAGRAISANRYLAASLPLLALLFIGILWGSSLEPWHPEWVGALTAAGILILWSRRRAALDDSSEDPTDGARRLPVKIRIRPALGAAGVLCLAIGITIPLLPAAGYDRVTLRDKVDPPLVFAEYASPLALTRSFETDLAKTKLLTLAGTVPGTRVRIATMDSYDGLNATIGAKDSTEARFQLLGPRSTLKPATGNETQMSVTIDQYAFPWVPTLISTSSLRVQSVRDHGDGIPLYFDSSSDTLLMPAGTIAGDVIVESVDPSAAPTPSRLEPASIGAVPLGHVVQVPPAIAAYATKIVGSESNPHRQILALQQALTSGFYSDGSRVPSSPGHGAARLSAMVQADALIGDDEQYAALMMLLCSSLDIPARIAMGFVPSMDGNAADVSGEDVHAWVEVLFNDLGWVAFDVTPERDRLPLQQTTQKVSNPEPQVLQPPPPPQDPARLPPTYEEEEEQQEQPKKQSDSRWLFIISGISGLLLLPPLIVLGIKAVRRSGRHHRLDPIERALGAWDEIVDGAADYGQRARAGATRRECAAALDEAFPSCDLSAFGEAVDRLVFSRSAEADPVDLWDSVPVIVKSMGTGRNVGSRIRARLSLRSLIRAPKITKNSTTARERNDRP